MEMHPAPLFEPYNLALESSPGVRSSGQTGEIYLELGLGGCGNSRLHWRGGPRPALLAAVLINHTFSSGGWG